MSMAARSSKASTSRCPRARCTPSWARTAPASRRSPTCWPAREDYEVTEGDGHSGTARDLLAMEPDERAATGVFLAFQYPMEIPGVATMTFLRTALNAVRKARGEAELSTPEFLKLRAREGERLKIDPRDAEAAAQRRLLRRREEAQRDPADGGARAVALRARRDRFRPRHRRAAHRRRRRQRAARSGPRDAGHHPLPAAARTTSCRTGCTCCPTGAWRAPAGRSWRSSWRRPATPNSARQQAA